MVSPWHILQVPPYLNTGPYNPPEFLLKLAMNRDGIETYCPFFWLYRHKSRVHKAQGERKRDKRYFPLLPKYLYFRGGDKNLYWLYRRGLLNKMLGVDECPATFTDKDIHEMRHGKQCVIFCKDLPISKGKKCAEKCRKPWGSDYDPGQDLESAAYGSKEYEAYMSTHEEFKPGDLVEYRRGWYADVNIKVVDIRGPSAKIVFDFMGKPQKQDVNVIDLRKAKLAA